MPARLPQLARRLQLAVARHVLHPGRTDPSIKDFTGYLTARKAQALQRLIRTRLATQRTVMQDHAWSGFAGLLDLHALKTDLDALFCEHPGVQRPRPASPGAAPAAPGGHPPYRDAAARPPRSPPSLSS